MESRGCYGADGRKNAVPGGFFNCCASGCMNNTRAASFPSMTMRTGLSYCTEHVSMEEVAIRSKASKRSASITLIFFDVELSRDGEIEQVGACCESGEGFSAVIRTSMRTNTSPVLSKITPAFWNMING
jgi:hypothetical protein